MKIQGCPFKAVPTHPTPKIPQDGSQKAPESETFGPAMPIVVGRPQIPSAGTILKRLFLPPRRDGLPPLQRSQIGLSSQGPKGSQVESGNQWPHEPIHPQFPEYALLSGREKAEALAHYARASRRKGELEPLGQFGITAAPQLILDALAF
jgi:hypothetical protein